MTNIQVPVCTMLELDEQGQLHMNKHNKNAFNYPSLDVEKATEYAKFKKVPTHSLDIQYQNEHTKTAAQLTK